MSKKKEAPKPESYDELIGDLVSLIRQFKTKITLKSKPAKVADKPLGLKRLTSKKPKGSQP